MSINANMLALILIQISKYNIPITLSGTVILSNPFGVNNSIIVTKVEVISVINKILIIFISLKIIIIIKITIKDTINIVSYPVIVLLSLSTLLLNLLPIHAAKPSP